MIYPNNFEKKIGFSEIRTLLKGRCLSSMGVDEVNNMAYGTNASEINKQLAIVKEFRTIMNEEVDFPTQNFNDMRPSLLRLQIKGTYMEEQDLFALRNTVETLGNIVTFLTAKEDSVNVFSKTSNTNTNHPDQSPLSQPLNYKYPLLAEIASKASVFPRLIIQVDSILNTYGKIKDDASPELLKIRQQLAAAKRSVSISLRSVLVKAQTNGWIEKDANPTYRDGRLVLPVKPEMKRKMRGIVHDESATGKTIYIEPAEVVEANNRIRTLEAEEQRAIIVILQVMAEIIRPQISEMLDSFSFLGKIDFIRAKSVVADKMDALELQLKDMPAMDWQSARHPLLESSLHKQNREIIPLDIKLNDANRILLISGPNAGGKSVCLKTVALLQYMMQCGMSVPVSKGSKAGVFESIFLDIGDEQSIENDLSTYSSHLQNMKIMMKQCSLHSLILIDEFGSGTEPQIGAAIAQAMLDVFLEKATYGVITTHYQSLKYFADNHQGIVNGAMLYDRSQLRPLFTLQIGNPGSSFAIEIARSIGLPQQVIEKASSIVGDDYIKSNKYLQDIVRDKRYWENKRLTVHQKERALEQLTHTYETRLTALDKERKILMNEAKNKAEILLNQSNAVIENTIRSIRQAQAEKEETKRLRSELNEFKSQVLEAVDDSDDSINRKMEQIRRRQEKRAKAAKTTSATGSNADSSHNQNKNANHAVSGAQSPTNGTDLTVGSYVKLKGNDYTGVIIKLNEKEAIVQAGMIKLTVSRDRLEKADKADTSTSAPARRSISKATRDYMHDTSINFKANIDVRGMNGQEALETVTYFIEDAIQCNASRLTILHGTGTGYLRQIIRQYLHSVPAVGSYHDEHVQFGGAGITVVEMSY